MARRTVYFDPDSNVVRQYGQVDEEEVAECQLRPTAASAASPKPSSKHFDPFPNLVRKFTYVEGPEEECYESFGGRETPAGRLLRQAAAALHELKQQSGWYPGIGWAVGAYLSEAGEETCYAVSNEGRGYLPYGLRWDPEVKPVFGLSVPVGSSPSWQGAANPARVIADHFEHQRRLAGGKLQLITILASAPLGRPVMDLLRQREAAAPTSVLFPVSEPGGADGRLSRLHTVSAALVANSVRPVPVERRWEAGCALAASAVAVSGVAKQYPLLEEVMAKIHRRESEDLSPAVRQAYWRLVAQAQALRVEDDRAGAVLLDPTPRSRAEHNVLPRGGVLGYAKLFWGARACAILDLLSYLLSTGRELEEADLAELAYEHYCVAEDVKITAEVLSGFIS